MVSSCNPCTFLPNRKQGPTVKSWPFVQVLLHQMTNYNRIDWKNEPLNKHQHDMNYLNQQKPYLGKIWDFNSTEVRPENVRRGLWPIPQPTTWGWARCNCLTFGGVCVHPFFLCSLWSRHARYALASAPTTMLLWLHDFTKCWLCLIKFSKNK